MSKVICDICGMAYPSSASNCPICGSSREYALEYKEEDVLLETDVIAEEQAAVQPKKKTKEIFDYDEVNQVRPARRVRDEDDFDDDDDDDDEDEDDDGESRTNVGLVIVLVILIVLLLLTAGFFFVKYLLPNMVEPEETQPIVTTAPVETEPVETTEPTIPCSNLSMDGGKMELGKDGKKLLNVRVYPENTTDSLVYLSGDESIVTVSEDGSVTAVGEGETVITIQCGTQSIVCNVTVDYSADEETVPEGTIPAMEVEDSTEPTGETQAEETTEATTPVDTLKLKKDDITISSNYTSVKLELEGDVDPATLSWFTMDSTIAICHDGVVTSTGSGMTRIYGEANGQQVMCIVRCIF